MMSTLLIGAAERVQIARQVLLAAGAPLDPAKVIAAAKADLAGVRDMMEMYSLDLPVGFHVTYSQETQPFGLCHHLSVSVERPYKMPHPSALEMVLREFGMAPLDHSIKVWAETIGRTTKAVNVVQLVKLQ